MTQPRRTCPACARRWAGIIAPDCLVCHGLGTLTLGAAALRYWTPEAIALAIELYLEATATEAAHTIPAAQRADHLTAAVDELRHAGILARNNEDRDATATQPRQSAHVTSITAVRVAKKLGAPVTPDNLDRLNARPRPVDQARQPRHALPTLSDAGHPAHLAQLADPIDALGPDTVALANTHDAQRYAARVITAAVPHAAQRKAQP